MPRVLRGALAFLSACGLLASSAEAAVRRTDSPALAAKAVRHPGLHIPTRLTPAKDLRGERAERVQRDLAALGIDGGLAFYDARAARVTSFILSRPLVPGDGYGNTLAGASPRDDDDGRAQAWDALRAFLNESEDSLRVDAAELGEPSIGVFEAGALVQVHAPRVLHGIPVRDSGLSAVVNHGNLVLLGLRNWAEAPAAADVAGIGEAAARLRVAEHVFPWTLETIHGSRLEYVPMTRGEGYEYRRAWSVRATVAGDVGNWEALVDAGSGEILSFEDENQYARKVTGGVYPLSNDQVPPDGVEQPGWPMPHAGIVVNGTGMTTNANGTFGCPAGLVSFAMAGPFLRVSDACGAANEVAAAGDLDLGFGPTPAATDCAVPPGHSAGDTKSSRTNFHELNRIMEQARGYLPGNTWLQSQLVSNVNLALSCNAFFAGGSINFSRSGPGCVNPGEVAGIVFHEWGHGMDANGVFGISRPSEGIADVHAILRTARSCVARGLRSVGCDGYGDACDPPAAGGCTGLRDVDFLKRRCDQPHGIDYVLNGFTSAQCGGTGPAPACPTGGTTGPCGRLNHCESHVVSETIWDLQARDLRAAPFNLDPNTALELTTRLVFLGSQLVTDWYTCIPEGGGCGATGGYLLLLAADDDNGNLADGTPHMSAIRAAFERRQIHCATPVVSNSGCAGGPSAAPVVSYTPGPGSMTLAWAPVAGAESYRVYRADGVSACDSGKLKVGEVTGTSFTDTGLLGSRPYSWVVLPVGTNTSCFGRASACETEPVPPAVCGTLADFSLSCAPAAVNASPNGSATSTCTVFSTNAFASAVGLSCANLPAGVTCAFDPATVTPPANGTADSTLTITVGGATAPGTYPFQAQGESGALMHTADMFLTVSAQSVLASGLAVDTGANGVLEAGETAILAPTWRNTGTTAVTLSGATSSFTGPPGPVYSNPDAAAAYPSAPAGALAGCAATGDCYEVGITATARPATHWDASIVETVTPTGTAKTWTLHVGDSFTDVPRSSGFYGFVETLLHHGVTSGCTATDYCPSTPTSRDQMAVFVLVAKEAPGYAPPACGAAPMFPDVPAASGFCRWVEELARRGVVGGCGGGNYCPVAPATREQMAVFVLRTLDPALNPPDCTVPLFADVPASSGFCKWIEELARRGVVSGCGGGNYCPAADVTREQMAVFLAVTFDLALYGP